MSTSYIGFQRKSKMVLGSDISTAMEKKKKPIREMQILKVKDTTLMLIQLCKSLIKHESTGWPSKLDSHYKFMWVQTDT